MLIHSRVLILNMVTCLEFMHFSLDELYNTILSIMIASLDDYTMTRASSAVCLVYIGPLVRAVGAGPAGAAAAGPKFGAKRMTQSWSAMSFSCPRNNFFTSLYGSLFAVHSLLSTKATFSQNCNYKPEGVRP